jgi:3'-5' exoribonuclease
MSHDYISLVDFKAKVNTMAQKFNEPVQHIVNNLFYGYPDIFRASGSSKPEVHHYGENGLAQHTMEVIDLCMKACEVNPKPVKEILFLAALFHDVGKAWDYKETSTGAWEPTLHKNRIHHISRSTWIWRECADELVSEFLIDEISHCILSHHGRREWGSPVLPQTPEAYVLHLCDSISARLFEL